MGTLVGSCDPYIQISVVQVIVSQWLLPAAAGPSCWGEGFTAEYCCRGQRGRDDCWDSRHTYETCCYEYKNSTYPFNDLLWGRRELGAVDPRRYAPKGKIAAAHLACILEMQRIGHWEDRECSKFKFLVDSAVEQGTPGSDTRAQYLGTHYRLLLRSFPYASFASPVFDAFYKARSFPNEFWGRDDFALFEAAFRAILAPGHFAVDGGANIGGYTQMMALAVGSSGAVHSFEPFRITFQFLNANVVLAGLQNVYTYKKALSNRNGAKSQAYGTDIQDPTQQMIWNSLVIPREVHWQFDGGGMWMSEPSELEQLEHITLDSLKLDRLDFIKSDVEGMEGHLFLGGLQTIQTYWPSILVEIKEFQRRAIHTFLVAELGYSCHSALTTNPSDFFCWHPRRAQTVAGEARRIEETLNILTTDRAFQYCEACRKRTPAPIELGDAPAAASVASAPVPSSGSTAQEVAGISADAAPTKTVDEQESSQMQSSALMTSMPGLGPPLGETNHAQDDPAIAATIAATPAVSTTSTTLTTAITNSSFMTTTATTASEGASSNTTSTDQAKSMAPCIDNHKYCEDWAANGQCSENPRYMLKKCRRACKVC